MSRRYHSNKSVSYNSKVLVSFQKFADLIGYKNSPYRQEFISHLGKYHPFLYKFENFSRTSRFWEENKEELTERDQNIRDALNNEINLRRNPKLKIHLTNRTNISTLASFIFCPVSCAINLTFETEISDEIYKSEELRNSNFVETFLKHLRLKLSYDYLFDKMYLDKKDLDIYKIRDEYISKDKHIIELSYDETKVLLGKRASLLSSFKSARTIRIDAMDFSEYCANGEYGELFTSQIELDGNKKEPTEPYFSNTFEVSGIPDYILKKKNNSKFILLTKYTWRNEIINQPFWNHVIQAASYLYFLPQLEVNYAYILYFQSIRETRLFKVCLNNSLIEHLKKNFKIVNEFRKIKIIQFDPNSININKCFKCSVRMYCSHKSGLYKKLVLPYKIYN